jgi:hypothetical protein
VSDGKPWIESLRKSIDAARCTDDSCITCNAFHMDDLMAALMPHMESAYKVGRMKATARIGRRYVTKNLELSRKLRGVHALHDLWAKLTLLGQTQRLLGDLGVILGDEEIASEAEADIRKTFADRAVKAIWAMNSPEVPGSEHYRSGWADGLEAAMVTLRRLIMDDA